LPQDISPFLTAWGGAVIAMPQDIFLNGLGGGRYSNATKYIFNGLAGPL